MYQKTIKLFLYDGNPNERIICELSNWNGIAYKIPRNMLKKTTCNDLKCIENTGVYFLIGEKNGIPCVYIGEAENVYKRLIQHLSDDKEFWEECLVFTRTDNTLNKAHIKYMENILYLAIRKSARYEVDNSTEPTKSTLSMTDEAEIKEFIDNIKLLTGAMGYKIFVLPPKIQKNSKNEYYFKSNTFCATAVESNDGFVVLKGSKINSKITPSLRKEIIALRNRLILEHIISENFIFLEDYVFSSSSTAAGVIAGYSISGPQNWKNSEGKTLKENHN